jgi:hypothetical protein
VAAILTPAELSPSGVDHALRGPPSGGTFFTGPVCRAVASNVYDTKAVLSCRSTRRYFGRTQVFNPCRGCKTGSRRWLGTRR